MDKENESLFDNLKTTAAFAECIFSYHLQHDGDFCGQYQ
jgi:hypothetical protein